MKITINEIAKKSGVSRSTVSRVLNNDPNVKQITREKVQKVIKEMDYMPSTIARSMVTGNLPIILVIVGDVLNHYFASSIIGIQQVLEKAGYMAVVYNSEYDVEKEKKFIKMAGECRFAGIITMTAVKNDELEESLSNTQCPIVLVNRRLKNIDLDSVYTDDFRSGYIATKHLIENGHRKIAHISGPDYSSVSKERKRGYCEALEDSRVEVSDELILKGRLSEESGYEIAPIIFANKDVTAVAVNNLLMCLGIARYAREKDYKIPDDLSIVCCETIYSDYYETKLTNVGTDAITIGKQAAELLLERINKSDKPIQKILFSPELRKMGSVKNIGK